MCSLRHHHLKINNSNDTLNFKPHVKLIPSLVADVGEVTSSSQKDSDTKEIPTLLEESSIPSSEVAAESSSSQKKRKHPRRFLLAKKTMKLLPSLVVDVGEVASSSKKQY